MDDLPIDALDLGRIGCPPKRLAELFDALVDVHAGLTHTRTFSDERSGGARIATNEKATRRRA